jgi:hypothetical protein
MGGLPVTSCRPNVLWEFVRIGKTSLPSTSLGAAFSGSGISIGGGIGIVALDIGSQVPGTLVAPRCRFLCLENFNHHFAAHAIVRVGGSRFIGRTDCRSAVIQ